MTDSNTHESGEQDQVSNQDGTVKAYLDRRRLLKSTGVAGLAGLAGCTGIGGDGGDGGGGGGGNQSDGGGGGGGNQSDGGGGGGEKKSFTIGIIIPMSGTFSSLGSLYRPAFKTWEKITNQNGGINGHEVTLKFKDNQSKEQRTSRIASRFASQGVDFMINAYSSPLTRAAGNVAEKEQIPLFSTGSVNYQIHAGFDYVLEFEPPFVRRASGNLLDGKVSKVACWAVDLGWAKLGQKGFINQIAPEHGLEVVYSDTHARDQRNFESFVLKAKNKGADAAVLTNYPEHVVPQTRAINNSDWEPTYVSQTTASSQNIYDQLGGDVMEGLCVPTLWTKEFNLHPVTDKFIKIYESTAGGDTEAEYHGALAFGSLQVFGEAVRKLGNKAKDPATLRDWFMNNTAPTVLGTSKFDDRGVQVGFPWSEAQWHGQETPIIWPEENKTAEFIYPKQWPK